MPNLIDLTGYRFGRWRVMSRDLSSSSKSLRWNCVCSCGRKASVFGLSLLRGRSVSCGCFRIEELTHRITKDLTGMRFGRLVAMSRVETKPGTHPRWVWRCDCGAQKDIRVERVKDGTTTSCGCYHLERIRTKGGISRTPAYGRAAVRLRQARQLSRTPGWADLAEIRRLYAACPPGMHVDHEIPLCGRNVSGLHVPSNLRLVPAEVNLRKSNLFNVESQR